MLSSVTDLLRYIDENQLTSEFGGTLDYCHSDWILLRTVSKNGNKNSSTNANVLNSFHLLNRMDVSFTIIFQTDVCLFGFKQAIESFAVTVKDIAQMLQSFGTELAETELPDEGKIIENLLETHTEKYRELKVSGCTVICFSDYNLFFIKMVCCY